MQPVQQQLPSLQPSQWVHNPSMGIPGGGAAAGGGTQMSATAHEEALFQPYSTLDEPVMETIMRDVRAVASKLKVVMLPLDRTVRFFVPLLFPYLHK